MELKSGKQYVKTCYKYFLKKRPLGLVPYLRSALEVPWTKQVPAIRLLIKDFKKLPTKARLRELSIGTHIAGVHE